MDRRRFLLTSLAGAVAAPRRAAAEQAAKPRRIGYLSSLSARGGATQLEAIRQGLRDLGYVEARNLVIDARWAGGNYERLPKLAGELVALNPELIISAGGPPAARALKTVTTTIPIVFISGSAVAAGIVSNSRGLSAT